MSNKLESNVKIAAVIFGADNLTTVEGKVLLLDSEPRFLDFYNGVQSDTGDLIQYFNKNGFQVSVCNAKVWIEEIATGIKSFHVPADKQVATAVCSLFEETFLNR